MPQRGYPPATLGQLAAIAGLLGFVGSLVPLFGIMLGLPAPIAVWAGVRCRSVGRPTAEPAPRSARRLAMVGIFFGVLGTIACLFWFVVVAYELMNSRDPFRGL